uniref:Toxin secretion/phage lysis holin n=1 Tax=uncultured bacterium Contig643 TaxID=1393602 RepID=W0FMQ3_9BACT|nr:toxin secretion/phage lysis holin [uncultured bacterium Contig643]
MKGTIITVKMLATIFGGILGFMFGELDGLIIALVFFVSIDYISGVFCAIVEKKLSSEVGAKGIMKKMLIFALVAIANIIDVHIFKQGATIRTAVIFYYLSNEGLSILENAARLGIPIPDKLRAVLEQLNDDNDIEQIDGGDTDVTDAAG